MVGLAGFMQLASIPESPSMFRADWERCQGVDVYDINDVSIQNHDGID
jgi:hypothetical protein